MKSSSGSAQKGGRTAFYDNLKFILIALVVSGHLLGLVINGDLALKAVWRWIYMFHMPAFLFVGGMFAKKLYTQEKGLRVNVIAFYLIMGIAFYTLLWLEKSTWGHPGYNLLNIGSIPWYFFVMAGLGISTPIIAKIRGGAKTVIPLSIVVSLFASMSPNMDDFLCLGRLVSYAPFYFAGYFIPIKEYVTWVQDKKKRIWPVVLAIVFMIALLIALRYMPTKLTATMANMATGHNPYKDSLSIKYQMAVKFLDIIIATIMIICISLVTPTRNCLISGLGSRTLQVYIGHPIIYYPIDHFKLLEPLSAYNPWAGLVVIACAILLATLLAIPKWPENMFQAIRKRINIDNNA